MTPGSHEAVKAGCTCPIMDNAHGRGVPGPNGKPVFWTNEGCPTHHAPQHMDTGLKEALQEFGKIIGENENDSV